MSQKDNDSGEIAIDNFTELTQLVKSTLQTVDELFPPKLLASHLYHHLYSVYLLLLLLTVFHSGK